VTSARHCIFTSAGDRNNIAQWFEGQSARDWDLITVYYDDDPAQFEALRRISSVCIQRKGSKFQNLKALFDADPKILGSYARIWVSDDDVRMNADQISQAFKLCDQFDFWVAQPAFAPESKAPHPVTRSQHPGCDLRLVTFLEMTCPIFRADKLADFLGVYDPSVMGWGIDWWYCHHLGSEVNWRLAVLDCVQVVNPLPEQRPGGEREILRLASNEERQAQWDRMRNARDITYFEQRTLARITLPAT
jgi:hypothetical protein